MGNRLFYQSIAYFSKTIIVVNLYYLPNQCHTKENELYGQVGNGGIDHGMWTRPEDWPKNKPRPAYKVTSAHGGRDKLS